MQSFPDHIWTVIKYKISVQINDYTCQAVIILGMEKRIVTPCTRGFAKYFGIQICTVLLICFC